MTDEEAPRRWGYRGHLAPAVMDDEPVLAHALGAMVTRARHLATEQGHRVTDHPEDVTTHATVWVEDWDEHGPGLVTVDLADTLGIDTADLRRGPFEVRIIFGILS